MRKLRAVVAVVAVTAVLAGGYDMLSQYTGDTPTLTELVTRPNMTQVTVPVPVVTNPTRTETDDSVDPSNTQTVVVELPLGQPMAALTIPKLGKSWQVIEGVRDEDIKSHPGHYPSTVVPGQPGNFSVAGHRVNAMFRNINKLNAGDEIKVGYAGKNYVYRVYSRYVVPPTQWKVIDDNPDGGAPDRKLLTITTCLLTGHQAREVVHAELISESPA